jgi:hypothetical protein
MTRIVAAVILLCATLAGSPASAAGPAIDLSVGTLGISGSLVQPTGKSTDIRLSYGSVAFTRTDAFSNLVIDLTANLAVHETVRAQTVSVAAERVIRGGRFHLSAGLVYNLNSVNGTSIPTNSSVVIDGVSYSQKDAGEIFTVVRWPALAPYIGIGFGPRPHGPRRPAFFGDAGLYYQGRARAEFSASGAIQANYTKFQPYFDEGRRQLQAELAPLELYPVIQVGMRIPL